PRHENSLSRRELDVGVERRGCLSVAIPNPANSLFSRRTEYKSLYQRRSGRIYLLRLARCHRVSDVFRTPYSNGCPGQQKLRWFPYRIRPEDVGNTISARLKQQRRRSRRQRIASASGQHASRTHSRRTTWAASAGKTRIGFPGRSFGTWNSSHRIF